MSTVDYHLAVELDAAISPERFRGAFPEEGAFVLEGGGASARPSLDRASYMGAMPTATLRARRTEARDDAGRTLATVLLSSGEELAAVDPFVALREFAADLALTREACDDRYPFPFRAGVVGYIGYECGQTLERLPCVPRPSSGMPDMAFALHRWVIATSRDTNASWLSIVGSGATRAAARADAEAIKAQIEARLAARPHESPGARSRGSRSLRIDPGLSAADYVERIAIAKGHIAAGDAFEICLTNQHRTPLARERAWPLFAELLRANPAPFAAFLDLPEGAIVSSSPERFLSLDADGTAESRPIKGTRRRGRTAEEDVALACELATSEKDRAENAMIVDLVRNDFGRVCRFGSITVPDLYVVEPYAAVHQLVSTVRGQLDAGRDRIELLRACFPPGSMTGAPKIEAMSILEHLEPRERGVYSGALGWLDAGGAMDLSVVIRTVVVSGGTAAFSVGGAIVADSVPDDELDETRQKAHALVRALETVTLDTRHDAPAEMEPRV